MKRQLIAALLALNVAAVAVPSATFTVNASEVEAQADSATGENAAFVKARNAAITELKTKRNDYRDAALTEADKIITPAITALGKVQLGDEGEVARIKAKALEDLTPIADNNTKNTAKAWVSPSDATLSSDYYPDTAEAVKSLKASVTKDIDAAVNKDQINDLKAEYKKNTADLKSKTDLATAYSTEISNYKPNPEEKYSEEGLAAIIAIKANKGTLNASDYESQAELRAAADKVKEEIAKVDTLDGEKVTAELNKYKEDKKKELDEYKTTGTYTQAQLSKIAKYKADGKTAIDKADSKANVDAAYNAAVKNIQSVLSKEDTEKAVKALIEEIDKIGTVDRSNYNDKYAAIKSAQDNYNKLDDGSEGKDAVTNKDVLDKAEELYDDHKDYEVTKAISDVEKDIPAITKENRKEYKAELDRIKAAVDTLFGSARKTALTTKWNTAKSAYNAKVATFVTSLKDDLAVLINTTNGKIKDVADSTKADKVTDANKADVTKAIELYNEISEVTEGKDAVLVTYANAYNTLVKKLKAYTDKQEAAAAKLDLAKASIEVAASVEYTGSELRPDVVVKDVDGTVIASTDYITAYDNNVNVGKSTVTVLPKAGSKYVGSVSKEFAITAKAMTASNTKVTVENLYYRSGKARNSVPVVKVDGREIARNTDFEVSYKNNVNVGAATVTIKGVGNYEGTVSASYAIMPEKAKIASLKAGAKKFTVKAVQEKGAKYQVAYKVKGASKYKTVTTSSVSKTVKGLKKGKTYSVKVRAYQTINGKKYLGNYSNVKTVKVK